MLNFILGMLFMFLIMLIFSVLAINPREDEYRTQKGKGSQNHKVWEDDKK